MEGGKVFTLLLLSVLAVSAQPPPGMGPPPGPPPVFQVEIGGENASLSFSPPKIPALIVTKTLPVVMSLNGTFLVGSELSFSIKHNYIARIAEGNNTIKVPRKCAAEECAMKESVMIHGLRLGRTEVSLTLKENESTQILHEKYEVIVLKPRLLLDLIYLNITTALIIITSFGFGCEVEIKALKELLKKPIPPAIGFFCQAVLMPLIGFALAKAFQLEDAFSFAMLAYSCSPGGGLSNAYTALLGGDITLSLTMTFISTMLSLGTMPLWLFVLGRFFLDPTKVKIPYLGLFQNLLYLVIPCGCGVLLNHFKPTWCKKIAVVNKYISLLYVTYHIFFGNYVNRYVFEITSQSPILLAPAILLPLIGFIAGFVISIVCKQPKERALTIAIETGVQNVGIPVLVLLFAFPQPEGSLGGVIIILIANLTAIVPYICSLARIFHQCVLKIKKKDDGQPEELKANGQWNSDEYEIVEPEDLKKGEAEAEAV